jgi:glucosylceramidase
MRSWMLIAVLTGRSSAARSQAPPSGSGEGGSSAPDDASAIDAGAVDATPEASGGDATAVDAGVAEAGPAPPAAYVTTDDLSQALAPTPVTLGAAGDAGDAVALVTVDPATSYQTMVGFGASITDSSSYVMTQYLSASALAQLLRNLFDPAAGIGLTFLRQPMGASDFSSVGNFSYDDGASDPTLGGFNVTQDLKATVPILQQVLAIEPSVFVIGTPWSPPAWMKNNDSMNGTGGGTSNSGLAGAAYEPLGTYFVKFVQAYAQHGIPVSAITPQNEPLNGTATYPAMNLNAPSELALIAQDIGPLLQAAGLKTLVWAYDHNWDVESYPQQVVGDPTAGPFTEGAAFHCYAGDPSAMTTFHQQFPDKSVYMTECAGGTWQSDPFANTIDLVIDSSANWARVVALWNVALDENAGPQNDGCSTCRGVVTVNSQSGDVTYNADYYALGHFSRFVRPGAARVASTSSSGSLNQVAFRNADGRLAVVAHNTGGSALTVQVGSGAAAMSVVLPANAGVTLTWTPP